MTLTEAELIKALVSPGCESPSEIDGSISCWLCGALLEHEQHEDDCAYIAALDYLQEYAGEAKP